MDTAPCPDCDYEISVPHPREGQRVTCPNCGAELEVLAIEPLELDWAYTEPEDDWSALDADEDEDWDDDWEVSLNGDEDDEDEWDDEEEDS